MKMAELSQSRAEAAKQASDPDDGKGTVQPYQTSDPKDFVLLHNKALNGRREDKKALAVKLKAIDAPTFSGEDRL